MSRELLELMGVSLRLGDCIDVMRGMPDASVDSIVTDPPYELGFMGKGWDKSGIANNVEMWREALRVLKPGGHLLAFSGTRTYHRMVCAIEDAGFEVRDQIGWAYGSGFPKSLDVSKAIDKAAGAEREVVGASQWASVRGGKRDAEYGFGDGTASVVTAPATDAAHQWQGWGTALKPAWEPICVARKPLIGTVAENVLAHGTGALNIDGCRVHSHDSQGYAYTVQRMTPGADQNKTGKTHQEGVEFSGHTKDGRWPANIIHDGSDEVLAAFPQAPGQMAKASTSDTQRAGQNTYGAMARGSNGQAPRGDAGSAARFFKSCPMDDESAEIARFMYCAKASKSDRGEGNTHPTVKPTELMRYLCRLVTPPGGVVLDPFMGSGSTGKAAILGGFQFIGIDMTPEYVAIAEARCLGALTHT